MNGNRPTNIHWRMTQYTIWVCAVLAFLLLTVFLNAYRLGWETLWTTKLSKVPVLLVAFVLVLLVGACAGFLYGYAIKRRLSRLIEAILRFERGNFSYRLPDLGEDEIGLVGTRLNQMAERIEKQVASLQKLSTEKAEWVEAQKQAVISEERQRLARELHDAVSQQLFAISLMASAMKETLPEAEDSVGKQIAMIEKMAGIAQNEMRALLLQLRPVTLEGKGLKEGLAELLDEFGAKHPASLHWEVGDLPRLPKGVEDHLFRIVQEGLSNVFRHAQATSVTVRLVFRGRHVHLRMIDNGVGFDMSKVKSSSYGLQSIQERASEIGGIAEVISVPGKGTQIEVKVPIVVDGEGEKA
ncbi:two-component system, NarL family, sensor histidine kinase LiaS [Laceyella tengchongensis]|uniref:Sensor histidine kinase n=1 Tax=Laceyella tengchongensis TaxID=574699 RepID=A0AA46AG06_9BACL|nr:sensor histidine kinase [Laceyella tengchongensis]SMP22796.1 two-component system, NarL family, sensor histidine kinase LiaS [Laceyella tengchongensis]